MAARVFLPGSLLVFLRDGLGADALLPGRRGWFDLALRAAGEDRGRPRRRGSGPRRRRWRENLHFAYEHFCDTLDAIEAEIPPDVDPETEQADPWFGRLPLDPYAAVDPAEFFAVCGEAFFVTPHRLAQAYPA